MTQHGIGYTILIPIHLRRKISFLMPLYTMAKHSQCFPLRPRSLSVRRMRLAQTPPHHRASALDVALGLKYTKDSRANTYPATTISFLALEGARFTFPSKVYFLELVLGSPSREPQASQDIEKE